MSNLPSKPPEVPATIPAAKPPTAIPDIPKADTMEGKALRVILTVEEFDFYTEAWIKWFKDHPDFDIVEDQLDIHHICMETVMQYRCTLMMQQYPNRDFSQPYNQSFLRQQKARENLEARRTDRMSAKRDAGKAGSAGGVHFHGSVSIVAGEVSLIDRQKQADAAAAACEKFLASTDQTEEPLTASEMLLEAEIVEPAADKPENGNAN